MNRIIILFFLLMAAAPVMAQQVTGKWRPVKMYTPETGLMPLEPGALRNFLYEKIIEGKAGAELTALDSMQVEKQVIDAEQLYNGMKTELKADKTYTSYIGNEKRTGKYTYDAVKKILTTYPKGKPANKVNISFESGLMKMQRPGDPAIMYMQKM